MNRFRRNSFSVITLFLLPLLPLGSQEAAKKTRVLIVTGSDVPAHDWRTTTPVTRTALEASDRLEVFVCEDAAVLETSALSTYDVVVLNYRNPPTEKLSDAARNNLTSFVKGGKGLVALHFAVAAWSDWPEYQKLVGRTWIGKKEAPEGKASGHGPRGKFKVVLKAKGHPILKGLDDFDADDELYARLAGDSPIEVLATAYSADYSQHDEPMAWTLKYGEGRVYVNVLGHDARARNSGAFRALLTQGCEWAAGLSK